MHCKRNNTSKRNKLVFTRITWKNTHQEEEEVIDFYSQARRTQRRSQPYTPSEQRKLPRHSLNVNSDRPQMATNIRSKIGHFYGCYTPQQNWNRLSKWNRTWYIERKTAACQEWDMDMSLLHSLGPDHWLYPKIQNCFFFEAFLQNTAAMYRVSFKWSCGWVFTVRDEDEAKTTFWIRSESICDTSCSKRNGKLTNPYFSLPSRL